MSYIGKTPTAAPLTSGDIADGIISTAKIANDAVTAIKADFDPGKILQVLQTVKTDTFSTTTAMGSFTDVTGMSQAITPTASNSKIFVNVCGHFTNQTNGLTNGFRLLRGSTVLFIGDSSGSKTRVSSGGTQSGHGNMDNFSITFLDSPSTTNAVTYKLQAGSESGGTLFFGGAYLSSAAYFMSAPGSITVMEVAG